MKAFFNLIKTRINTNVPTIQTVRMFNDQMVKANGKTTETRSEKFFPYPAAFVEFIVNSVDSRCLGIKDYLLTVRFRFARESYKFERLETFDFVDTFDASIQMMAPSSNLTFSFTTLQEIFTQFDTDFNDVEIPYRDYRTRLRWSTAYQRSIDIQKNGVNLNVAFAGVATIDFSNLYNSNLTAAISGI